MSLDRGVHDEQAVCVDRFHCGATAFGQASDQDVCRRLDDGRKPPARSGPDAEMSGLRKGMQRRGQTLVPQDHRIEAAGQSAQLGDGLLELAVGCIQLRLGSGQLRPEQAERQRQAAQAVRSGSEVSDELAAGLPGGLAGEALPRWKSGPTLFRGTRDLREVQR